MTTLAEQIAALNLPPMSEEEVAKTCGLSMAQLKTLKKPLTADDVAFCEQARAIEILAPRWQSGIDPYPSDVSVNSRGRKKRKGSR